ncbi:hypothetical protein YC2023_103845 [Brassica napus]
MDGQDDRIRSVEYGIKLTHSDSGSQFTDPNPSPLEETLPRPPDSQRGLTCEGLGSVPCWAVSRVPSERDGLSHKKSTFCDNPSRGPRLTAL